MSIKMRRAARQILPKKPLYKGWESYTRLKARKARAAFENSDGEPRWLGLAELAALQAEYPLRPSVYRYDPEGLELTARQRVSEMLRLLPHSPGRLERFLDVGTWDGTSCHLLSEMGKVSWGIDIRVEGLAERVRAGGAHFALMDATSLGFVDETFDYVYSYNSFEHIPDPEKALAEMCRVTRPGGFIFLEFGPIYYTAKGAHQYDTISVPFCECLFTDETLAEFGRANSIPLKPFEWMNRWRVTQYRELWQRVESRLERIVYREVFNPDHLELILRYPGCFRSKTPVFDDLLVSNMEILFRKRVKPGE